MKFAVGMVLIDAPHSALNMEGITRAGADRNKVIVKKLRRGKDCFAYVSAQAWRYWWRETLALHFGWEMSGITKEQNASQAYTSANPINYPDDDVFGYMKALNRNKTVTRISPLKNTPLISIFPTRSSVQSSFSSFSRHEGDPVPYETEFYSTILKGAFSLDLEAVGRFTLIDRTGYKNIADDDNKLRDSAEKAGVTMNEKEWVMPKEVRTKRAKETIQALKYIYGGAKQTLFLTDVTPKFAIFTIIGAGVNPFISDIVREENGDVVLDTETIISRLEQYKDIIKSDIIIAKDRGFLLGWDEQMNNIKLGNSSKILIKDKIADAIENFAQTVEKTYE